MYNYSHFNVLFSSFLLLSYIYCNIFLFIICDVIFFFHFKSLIVLCLLYNQLVAVEIYWTVTGNR